MARSRWTRRDDSILLSALGRYKIRKIASILGRTVQAVNLRIHRLREVLGSSLPRSKGPTITSVSEDIAGHGQVSSKTVERMGHRWLDVSPDRYLTPDEVEFFHDQCRDRGWLQ